MTFTKEKLIALSNRENVGAILGDEIAELARLVLASRKAEPIYQVWDDGNWSDYDEELWRELHRLSAGQLRIVYTAPPAPVVQEVAAEDCPAFIKYDVTDVAEAWARGYNARSAAILQGKADGRYPRVPEEAEMPSGPGVPEYNVGWANGWNSCREEMLQSAEPVERLGAEFEEVLAELIDSEMEPVSQRDELPEGWVAVPVEPTEKMIIEGFESEPDEFFSKSEEWEAYQEMSGCEQAAHRAKLCWSAMLAAAPKP